MAKLSLQDLRNLRGSVQADMAKRDTEGKTLQIVVGMGTCGIAAGAKNTLDAFIAACDEKGLAATTIIRQSGCMGHCKSEPTVKVITPDMGTVLYGNVTPEVAKEIVAEHLAGKKVLDKYVIQK